MQVSIDRCFFRGSEEAIASARKALDRTRFPVIGDSEFVIIRQLSVSAETSCLEQHYNRQTERLLAAKVSGWSEDAASADCVWFVSETDLYACLCRDLALGTMDGLWYWKQFGQLALGTPSQRLARVMAEQKPQLPALLVQLSETGSLIPVWRRLELQERRFLLRELVPRRLAAAIDVLTAQTLQPPDDQSPVKPLPALLEALLSDIESTDKSITPEIRLAIALFLLSSRPHQAISQPVENSVRELIRTIAASGLIRPPASAPVTAAGSSVKPTAAVRPETAGKDASSAVTGLADHLFDPRPVHAEGAENAQAIIDDERQKRSGKETDTQIRMVESEATAPEPFDPGGFSSEAETRESEFRFTDQWYIAQGGLFYLLNILNQSVIRDLLLNDSRAVAFPSGWGWLYRLGEAFGLQYEREVVRCLARLSGMQERTFLDETPRLDAAGEILAFAEERYMRFGIWHASLLQKPAHVAFTRPEVTISFGMQDVDIELRKSGLDIDPGWVDWLGSMVRFRYRELL
jgi:hypothetical protein